MDEKNIYVNSILTFAFTNDGKLIVKKDKKGIMDTLPWIYMGHYENGSKMNYESDVWVIDDLDAYKEKIAEFFLYNSKNSKYPLLDGFVKGNANNLLDVGELHESIAPYQIEEMKKGETPSFIRVHKGLYDGSINQSGQQVINRIEIRYVVLSSKDNLDSFPDLKAVDFDIIKQDYELLSQKMIFGLTGSEGKIMETFIGYLASSNRGVKP